MNFNHYPKRDAIKNYFPMPNEIFFIGLSSGEILVYAYLMYCEETSSQIKILRRSRKTFQCYPSYNTIGKAVGMSKNTVRKYVLGLEEKHLITTEPTKIRTSNGRVHNGNLLYTIRPIQEAINYYYERQLSNF